MSDLGRLFRLSVAGPKPLENFTTTALAIAIGHDQRPIKQALRAIDCTCQESDRDPVLRAVKDGALGGVLISADTQKTLWPVDGSGLGYLDLVLTVRDGQARESTIWVEVKVDAWESGNQLAVYEAQAARCSSRPAIITLGRTQVSPHVPFLKWSDVVDAIDSVSDPHYTWASLREFLLEEKIVRPPVTTAPSDVESHIDVIVAVNGRIRNLWPAVGMAWMDGALRASLHRAVDAKQELITTGGPLRYGVECAEGICRWRLALSVARNYERVPLSPLRVLGDAETGGLPQEWLRHPYQPEVLERTLPTGSLTSHDEIVRWFDDGLRQLHDAGVLKSYQLGYATKQAKAAERARGNAEPLLSENIDGASS